MRCVFIQHFRTGDNFYLNCLVAFQLQHHRRGGSVAGGYIKNVRIFFYFSLTLCCLLLYFSIFGNKCYLKWKGQFAGEILIFASI